MGDREKLEGAEDKLEGDIKKDVGEAFGSRRLEIEGEGDEIKGDVHEGIGDVEGKADELLHRDKKDK